MYKQNPPTAPRCQHIHDTNSRCGSPALRGQPFCHWHSSARATNKKKTFAMPILDNPNSVQLGISQVISQLMSGQITPYHASVAFYGFQLASHNELRVGSYNRYAVTELTPAMEAELTAVPQSPSDDAVVPAADIASEVPCHISTDHVPVNQEAAGTTANPALPIPMPSLREARQMLQQLSKAAEAETHDASRSSSDTNQTESSKPAPSTAAVAASNGSRSPSSDPGKRPVASAKPTAKPTAKEDPVRDPDDLSYEELRIAGQILGFDREDELNIREFLRTTRDEEPSYYANLIHRMTARFRELHVG